MSAASKVAGHVSRAVQTVAPIEGTASYGGYWNFVSGSIILMFILYVAQKGHLSTWIGFFSGGAPASVGAAATAGGSSSPQGAGGQTGVAAAVNTAVNGTAAGSAISAITGVPPLTLGTTGGGLLGILGIPASGSK